MAIAYTHRTTSNAPENSLTSRRPPIDHGLQTCHVQNAGQAKGDGQHRLRLSASHPKRLSLSLQSLEIDHPWLLGSTLARFAVRTRSFSPPSFQSPNTHTHSTLPFACAVVARVDRARPIISSTSAFLSLSCFLFIFSTLSLPRRGHFSDADCHFTVPAPSCHLRQDGGQEETSIKRGRRWRPAEQATGSKWRQQIQGRCG